MILMDCSASESLPSRIASLVHAHFDGLPARSKPTIYPDGSREWIPMSGIVIVKGENTASEKLSCVAVTTGAKCLSASQVSKSKGLVLHDWHAEVLALRSFNYWLLSECHSLLAQEQHATSNPPGADAASSPFIRRRMRNPSETPSAGSAESQPNPAWPPFELQPDLKIYMYCTCAPCGDASMELCMAAQDDPRPWETAAGPERAESPGAGADTGAELLDGRGYFSRLGVVRRKPARADAEATLSKSCSDKLALRQVSSLLSYEVSLLVAPTPNAYIEGLVLPEEEISRVGCERCFGATGRMKILQGRFWPERDDSVVRQGYGYRFQPFRVLSVSNDLIESIWPFRKPKPTAAEATLPPQTPPKKNKPANVSAVWVAAPSLPHPCPISSDNGAKSLPVLRGSRTGLYETIINGVKQGNRAASLTPRGASALSRAKLWGLLRDIVRSSCSGDCTLEVDGLGLQPGNVTETGLSLQDTALCQLIVASTYEQFKKTPVALTPSVRARKNAIREAKEALKGWIANQGDEQWGLDVLIDPKKRKR